MLISTFMFVAFKITYHGCLLWITSTILGGCQCFYSTYRKYLSNIQLFLSILKGKFTVKKTNRVFSNMGEDQAHEGGAIGILDSSVRMGCFRTTYCQDIRYGCMWRPHNNRWRYISIPSRGYWHFRKCVTAGLPCTQLCNGGCENSSDN